MHIFITFYNISVGQFSRKLSHISKFTQRVASVSVEFFHHADKLRVCTHNIWDSFRPHGYIIKCYKNASRSNRYNFPTVNAINVLLSSRHSTPLHYRKKYFGALHQFFADATRSDTPWGSKLPHLQVGAFKSLQIQYVLQGSCCD